LLGAEFEEMLIEYVDKVIVETQDLVLVSQLVSKHTSQEQLVRMLDFVDVVSVASRHNDVKTSSFVLRQLDDI
jgi:hypothetical protein